MRLAIFTHVVHAEKDDTYFAYAPYVREMNLWLKYVEEVEVVAPMTGDEESRRPGGQVMAYEHPKLTFTEVPSFNFLNLCSSIKAIIKIRYLFFKIIGAMSKADHLHLRSPGNMGLLACIAQIFFPSKPKTAKYAGNWDPEAKQPWSYKFQKWILSNTFLTRNIQVLVYGEWPGQSKNIRPFFTATFSERDIKWVKEKNFKEPFIFLFVGNLVEGKRPLEAIKLVEELDIKLKGRNPRIPANSYSDQKIHARLEIYGDGAKKNILENYVADKSLEEMVVFKGNRSLEELKQVYQRAHFVILPSKSEGWPKAIAEGMFFGCIPIATPVSCVPWMLGGGSRGILVSEKYFSGSRVERGERTEESENQEPGAGNQEKSNPWAVGSKQRPEGVDKIFKLMRNPEEMERMSEAAKEWSQQYTMERFEGAIKHVLQRRQEYEEFDEDEF